MAFNCADEFFSGSIDDADNMEWASSDPNLEMLQSNVSPPILNFYSEVEPTIDPALLLTQHQDFVHFTNGATPFQYS